MSTALPFLRWAGGKRRLLPTILGILPPSFDTSRNRLYEPFVGGGAVMLALSDPTSAHCVPGNRLVINDANPDLALTYAVIRDDVEGLVRALRRLARDTSKAAFERVKASAPRRDVDRAARFIFLNRTCFNGLWRVNSRGEFNVPFGNIANPLVCDAENLRAVSARLHRSVIRTGSYVAALADARAGDLVYLDPPYLPLSPSASFSKYAKDDFGQLDQFALAGVIRGLTDRGVFVVLSNSDTPLTRQIFSPELELHQLSVHRSISASAASRASVKEVLGSNYPLLAPPAALTRLSTPARNLLRP